MSTFGDILKQAEQSGATFEVLEAGVYVAKIIESEYKNSSTGKPQIKTRWEVVVGPKAGYKGLWNYFTLTVDNPQAMAIFYRQMLAVGITNEFLSTLSQASPEVAMKQIAVALEGRMANIKVAVDKEYNNNKIERINPVPPEFSVTQSAGTSSPFPGMAPVTAAQPAVPVPVPPTAPVAMAPAPTPVAAPVQPEPTTQPLPAAPF